MEKDHIIISDTDSLYICLEPILTYFKNQGIEITPENKTKIILKLTTKLQLKTNNNLNSLVNEFFNIKNHFFSLKQEVIAQSVLVTGKRRYGMYVINKEGVSVSEFDAKGLELFKSNMNKIFREFGETLIKNILFGKPKREIDQSIIDLYKSIKNLDPKYLGKPTGVSFIKKYIKSRPLAGEIFSKFELKAPVNTKAAIRYNDLLKFKRLDKQYESIIEGDKIFIINLKPNPYQIETIGIPNSSIPAEIDKFIKNYIDVDEIFESILLEKLKELYKDIGWKFVELNSNVNKFFVYE